MRYTDFLKATVLLAAGEATALAVVTIAVVAGDELVCVNTIEEITSRGGHDFLSTRTEVSTVGGEPVVTVWSKFVIRGEG